MSDSDEDRFGLGQEFDMGRTSPTPLRPWPGYIAEVGIYLRALKEISLPLMDDE